MSDNELSELKDADTILAKIVEYAKCGLAHNGRDHEIAFKWGDFLRTMVQQRDTAWRELREIREAIKADESESTADEVRSLVKRLAALEDIATAVEADIDAGRPLEYNVEDLRVELIRARKALGILPDQEQTTTLGMEQTL